MTSGGLGWYVWRRRASTDRVLVVALAATVLVAALALAAVPRVVERASIDDIRHTVASAAPERRNVRLGAVTRIAPVADDPLGGIRARGDALVESLPEVVGDVVESRRFVVDSPPFRVTSYPERRSGPFTISFSFRLQEGIDEESTLVDGDLPDRQTPIVELAGTECEDDATVETFVSAENVDCRLVDVPVFDTVVTRQTAEDMEVDVGDMVTLTPDQSDLRWQQAGLGDARVVLRVAGIVELTDVDRDVWFADNRLHGARITENPDFRIVDATGVLAPADYAAFQRALPRVGFDHAWRLYVDAGRLDVELADDLAIALANADLGEIEIATDLPGLVREFRDQRTIVLVLLSAALVGLGVVVAATAVALTRLLALRRAASTALIAARGASRRHLVVDAARTALVVVAPAVVVGGTVAAWAFPATDGEASALVLAGLAAGVAGAIVAVLGRPERGPVARGRRLVVDATVVVAAVAAVLSVRRRGDVSVGGVAEVDLLLAATPALVVIATALVLVRVVPLVGRAMATVAERGPRAPVFLGLRQLVTRPGGARVATGVMAIAVGIAVVASAMQTSIATARSAAAWYDVGGEIVVGAEVQGAPLPIAVDDVAGIADVARRVTADRSTIRYGADSATVDVVAVDAERYAALLADAPIDREPLEALAVTLGAPGAIVSTAWPRGSGPGLGDDLTIDVGAGPTAVVVTAVADTFPAVRVGRPFVVVDIEAAGVDLRPSAVVLDDPDLASQLGDVPRTRIVERADVVDERAADPLGRWTIRVLTGVALLSGLFAIIAAVTSVVISVRARDRDLSILRTLGLRVRDGSTMTAIEQIPPLAVASIGGVLAGAGTVRLLQTAFGLARFAGPDRPVAIRLDPGATLFTGGMVALAMTVAVVLAIRVQRRHDLAATLRVGDTT